MIESYNAVKYTVYLNRLNHIDKRGKKQLQCIVILLHISL